MASRISSAGSTTRIPSPRSQNTTWDTELRTEIDELLTHARLATRHNASQKEMRWKLSSSDIPVRSLGWRGSRTNVGRFLHGTGRPQVGDEEARSLHWRAERIRNPISWVRPENQGGFPSVIHRVSDHIRENDAPVHDIRDPREVKRRTLRGNRIFRRFSEHLTNPRLNVTQHLRAIRGEPPGNFRPLRLTRTPNRPLPACVKTPPRRAGST